MYTNVNLAAPIGALALLGAASLLFMATIFLVQSLIVRRTRRAKVLLLALMIIGAVYLGAMLAFSFASHDRLLAHGEEKHFCELDCHLAYSIAKVAQANTFGEGAGQTRAQGQFTIITIKTRFDETTIGPRRGDSLLFPNDRAFSLVDDRGNRFEPVAQAGTPLMTPLRPGESYMTDLAFDLPANAKPSVLAVNESAWETHLLIGHENSLLHGKTKFQI
jgi:hypothetical protein